MYTLINNKKVFDMGKKSYYNFSRALLNH